MVDAVAVNVGPIADIPAGTLPSTLGAIYGKAQYAADNVGKALYDSNLAKDLANAAQGTADYAAGAAGDAKGQLDNYVAPTVGKLDAEMTQIFTALGLTRS